MARKGFTMIELLVAAAIISALAGMIFPVFARAREKARQAGCLSCIKQLGSAALMYAADYGRFLTPPDKGWVGFGESRDPDMNIPALIPETGGYWPYVKNKAVFRCPDLDEPVGYAVNLYLSKRDTEYPTETGLIADSLGTLPTFDLGSLNWGARHHGGVNVCFADGHAKWVNPADHTKGWDVFFTGRR